jgi:hypothetical protein
MKKKGRAFMVECKNPLKSIEVLSGIEKPISQIED